MRKVQNDWKINKLQQGSTSLLDSLPELPNLHLGSAPLSRKKVAPSSNKIYSRLDLYSHRIPASNLNSTRHFTKACTRIPKICYDAWERISGASVSVAAISDVVLAIGSLVSDSVADIRDADWIFPACSRRIRITPLIYSVSN